jgi:hypothetical protein
VRTIKHPVIPEKQVFYFSGSGNLVDDYATSVHGLELDLEAIAFFVAAGFFPGQKTYFKDINVLAPATEYEVNDNKIREKGKYWKWNYAPREQTFSDAVEQFSSLFETIANEDLENKKVILPLSGGLDSRSQATALKNKQNISSYTYEFAKSFGEAYYGREIAKAENFDFQTYILPEGYLWSKIEELSDINLCYSDFTHPRQMAVIDEISQLGDIFHLGHWGDVLFDDMGVGENIPHDEQVLWLKKKLIKRGGDELARELWQCWNLNGSFDAYLEDILSNMLSKIDIDHAGAKLRAFKSLYWAPRWTSVNLQVFSAFKPIKLPYYDQRMCDFICSVPENHLAARKIQIEYIKRKAPELARIEWQDYKPFNLYNYKRFNHFTNLPGRAFKKLVRIGRKNILKQQDPVTRNWEIQFLNENDKILRSHLFHKGKDHGLLPAKTVEKFYNMFLKNDKVKYSHPTSMLLTLSVFSRKFRIR